MAQTVTPDPEKEARWRRRIAQQAASGLTVRDWCRQDGTSDSLFHYWKSTLAKRDGTYTPPPRRPPAPPDRTKSPAPAFAQVLLAAPQSRPQTAAPVPAGAGAPMLPGAIEIALPGARVVRVQAGFDPAALARVLDVLEARRC